MSQNLQNFVKFQKFQLENLVDFEKCCKTHIFLQTSEPIQPKTSNILPKFCQPTLSDVSASRGGDRNRGQRFERPADRRLSGVGSWNSSETPGSRGHLRNCCCTSGIARNRGCFATVSRLYRGCN